MTDGSVDRLYSLLPAVYRIRDAEREGPLQALLAIMEEQLRAIERDVGQVYDNWFIETCEPWVVPYIADLLGESGFSASAPAGFNPRSFVANTIAYRRRKGTVAVLEQLAQDVAQWPSHAVEFFQRIAVTQYLNHELGRQTASRDRPPPVRTPAPPRMDPRVRLGRPATVCVRDARSLELLEGPFDSAPHTIDVRRIERGLGWYNLPNIGLFLWRLQGYPVRRGDAHPFAYPPDGRYTFDPLGLDVPLFNERRTEPELTHLSREEDVPGRFRRMDLYDELENYRRALAAGTTLPDLPHFRDHAAFRIYVDAETQPVPPEEISICDLSAWGTDQPLPVRMYPGPDGTSVPRSIRLAVDPVLGRIAFPLGVVPSSVLVDYVYGLSGDVGGGPYDRRGSVLPWLAGATWLLKVSRDVAPVPEELVASLGEAVAAWNLQPPGTVGVIAVLDSHTYREDLTGSPGKGPAIVVPEGSRLVIVAAESASSFASSSDEGAGTPVVRTSPSGVRPVLIGDMHIVGNAPEGSLAPGAFGLSGLWIQGTVSVVPGNLGILGVADCTVLPHGGRISIAGSPAPGRNNEALMVELQNTICGPVAVAPTVEKLRICGCIIDAPWAAAIEAPGAALDILDSTVFGTVVAQKMEGSNSIFTEQVTITRQQEGCVRFSYVSPHSLTPRRYRCQPELGLSLLPGNGPESLAVRFRPAFTSTRCGDPAYGQLAVACPMEIQTGADDGSEMGGFRSLMAPQRLASLRLRLTEYLPTRMEAGVIYVT